MAVIILGEAYPSSAIAYLGQPLLAAWLLAIPLLRIVNPTGMVNWMRGFSPIKTRILMGKASWPQLTPQKRQWADLWAIIFGIVGSALTVLTIYQIVKGCEPFVIC